VLLFLGTVANVSGSRYAALLITVSAIVFGLGAFVSLNAGNRNRPH
jgi:hypothetical protein